ncbi:MAG: hypothetical protein PHC41_11405 [Lachnospiraceae bacterium]|nr:hypothetical protein [Lachnospiraceae bacterium]MDD3616814.1 hypothetical protein [Lachnospiraceae bacterium]
MGGVSSDSESLSQLLRKTQQVQAEVRTTRQHLRQKCQSMGSSWRDRKYQEFVRIIEECCSALQKVEVPLEQGKRGIQVLLHAISQYENVQMGSMSGSAGRNSGNVDNIVNTSSSSGNEIGFAPTLMGGRMMSLYGSPLDVYDSLIHKQGNNSHDMAGTCGLCQCANLLRMAGMSEVTENDVVEAAMQSSEGVQRILNQSAENPQDRGGILPSGCQEVLGRFGMETYLSPVEDYAGRTTTEISNLVRSGHGVMVGVNVERLWNNGQEGNHLISIISVSQDGNDFVISDTGWGSIGIVSASHLNTCLTGQPLVVTTNRIR